MSRTLRFNVMVAGENGTGKTTALHALFNGKRREAEQNPEFTMVTDTRLPLHDGSTTTGAPREVATLKIRFEDTPACARAAGRVYMDACKTQDQIFKFYDTRGFGESINDKDLVDELVKDITDRNDAYAKMADEEVDPDKQKERDDRIHLLILFHQPGRSAKTINRQVMERLHRLVPIVPVIGKADSMSSQERETTLRDLKRMVNELNRQFAKEQQVLKGGDAAVASAPIHLTPCSVIYNFEEEELDEGGHLQFYEDEDDAGDEDNAAAATAATADAAVDGAEGGALGSSNNQEGDNVFTASWTAIGEDQLASSVVSDDSSNSNNDADEEKVDGSRGVGAVVCEDVVATALPTADGVAVATTSAALTDYQAELSRLEGQLAELQGDDESAAVIQGQMDRLKKQIAKTSGESASSNSGGSGGSGSSRSGSGGDDCEEEGGGAVRFDRLLRSKNLFALVTKDDKGNKNPTREYPWGSARMMDPNHSDFFHFHRLLFKEQHITKILETDHKAKYNGYILGRKNQSVLSKVAASSMPWVLGALGLGFIVWLTVLCTFVVLDQPISRDSLFWWPVTALCLLLVGSTPWFYRRRSIDPTFRKASNKWMVLGGIALLLCLAAAAHVTKTGRLSDSLTRVNLTASNAKVEYERQVGELQAGLLSAERASKQYKATVEEQRVARNRLDERVGTLEASLEGSTDEVARLKETIEGLEATIESLHMSDLESQLSKRVDDLLKKNHDLKASAKDASERLKEKEKTCNERLGDFKSALDTCNTRRCPKCPTAHCTFF